MSDSSRLRTSFLLLLLVLFCPLLSHADVGFRRSLADSTSSNSLLRRPVQGISKFQPRAILEAAQPQAVFSVQFDSTFTRVVYTYRVKETDLLQPTVLTYDEYKALRYEADFAKQRRDETIKVYKRTRAAGSGEGIASGGCVPTMSHIEGLGDLPLAKSANGQPLTTTDRIERAAAAGLVQAIPVGVVIVGTVTAND